ncbi:hypothetical protein P885DRAFT_43630 [Corynascus similis CBS 632.67]
MSHLVPTPESPVSAAPDQQPDSTPTTPASFGSSLQKPYIHQPRGYATSGRRTHKKSRTGCLTCKTRKIKGGSLPLLELELLHNFTTKTYTTLTADSCLWDFWRDDVVQLGLSEDYIMRAVLAVSALHLAYHRPDRRDFYVEEGIILHQKASRAAMRVMASDGIDKDRAASLFIFSMLTMFFGSPPTSRPLLAPLRARIHAAVSDPDLLRTYVHALDELELALVGVQADPAAPRDVLDAMVWLWVVSDELLPLLRGAAAHERKTTVHQEAVAVFAHFGLLLRHHESHWWLQGWGDHVVRRASEILDEEHRTWIEWPLREMAQMRWHGAVDGGRQPPSS